jgi:hypothetical protein
MNLNIKVFLLCPVPENQKPINEYINIKENPLLNWINLPLKKYFLKIITGYLIIFPIFLTCFLNLTPFSLLEILKIFLISSTFVFLSIYVRWSSIYKKLTASRLFYEEASWFDGKIWEKPFFLIKNDKLLSALKIKPVLKRLLNTILCNCLILIITLNF